MCSSDLKNISWSNQGTDGIKTIQFNWKDGRDSLNHWGYTAQSVKLVFPDAVKTGTNGYLTVDYTQVHTAKIQALEKEVEELKQLVNQLLKK